MFPENNEKLYNKDSPNGPWAHFVLTEPREYKILSCFKKYEKENLIRMTTTKNIINLKEIVLI